MPWHSTTPIMGKPPLWRCTRWQITTSNSQISSNFSTNRRLSVLIVYTMDSRWSGPFFLTKHLFCVRFLNPANPDIMIFNYLIQGSSIIPRTTTITIQTRIKTCHHRLNEPLLCSWSAPRQDTLHLPYPYLIHSSCRTTQPLQSYQACLLRLQSRIILDLAYRFRTCQSFAGFEACTAKIKGRYHAECIPVLCCESSMREVPANWGIKCGEICIQRAVEDTLPRERVWLWKTRWGKGSDFPSGYAANILVFRSA
jgi:hypothetical protein